MGDTIPEDVRAFLSLYIESYEQLEILLLLRREPSLWTGQRLCSRLNVSLSLVQAAVSALYAKGLVQPLSGPSEEHYKAQSRAEPLDETMERLASVYADWPIEIIRLMSTNAIERVRTAALRTFVDAFVLRKHKDKDHG